MMDARSLADDAISSRLSFLIDHLGAQLFLGVLLGDTARCWDGGTVDPNGWMGPFLGMARWPRWVHTLRYYTVIF